MKRFAVLAAVLAAGLFFFMMLRPSGESAPVANTNEPAVSADTLTKATFAGGCFWCMEPPYDKLDGVHRTISGYAGGDEENPTYEEVSSGRTGHAEVVQVLYDPDGISYAELLDVYWRNIDPTTPNRQFCDMGSQYRPAIFYHDDEQRRLAEESKQQIEETGRFEEVVTEIEPLDAFYPAEEYHQNFYQKNPTRYNDYRDACGRDERLRQLWGERAGSS